MLPRRRSKLAGRRGVMLRRGRVLLWRCRTLLHQMGRRFVQRTADFAHDRVARKPELAQNFTRRAHYLRKIVGCDHDQRDQENQEYFEYTQVKKPLRFRRRKN
jgi:hypothetical protein